MVFSMSAKTKPNLFFRKKVYTKIYNPLSAENQGTIKKITPSSKQSGLREEFKRVFLPLLIDIFELRHELRNKASSPNETLKRLTELQNDIEESRRWCEGVILQIAKGIEEAKIALQFIEEKGDNGKDV